MSETFWLARGSCACGRPVARRVPGPGTHEVRCNVCHATSAHAAMEVRLGPHGIAPVAAPPDQEPRVRRRALVALLVVVGLVLVGALGLAATRLPSVLVADEWEVLEQRLVLDEKGERLVLVTIPMTQAGGPARLDTMEGVANWSFARGTDVGQVPEEGWEPCEAPACAFAIDRAPFVFIRRGDGDEVYAFHAADRVLFRYDPVWGRPWTPLLVEGDELLRVQMPRDANVARYVLAGGGPAEEHALFLFLNATRGGRDVDYKVVQWGAARDEGTISFLPSEEEVTSPRGTEFSVTPGNVEVVLSVVGGATASASTDSRGCASGTLHLDARVLDDGRVEMGPLRCAA